MTKNAKESKDGLRIASNSNLDLSSVSMNNTLQNYPSPLASYEQVVANKILFMSTLEKFHSEMGTKFWVPYVRYRDLDLHELFVEVTSRGGIEQVLGERKWKDVFDTLSIPERYRINIYSNRIRRDYYSLLHDYEIVYFSNARGHEWIGLVSAKNEDGYVVTLSMGSWKLEGVLDETIEKKVTQYQQRLSDDKANKLQKKVKTRADSKLEQRPVRAETTTHMEKSSDLMDTSLVSVPVTVVVDGRFENGYLVTVTMGSEKLRGFMYTQSPPLNTVTTEKLDKDEKAVYKEKALVEDKDQNCSDDLKTIAQLITEAKSQQKLSSKLDT